MHLSSVYASLILFPFLQLSFTTKNNCHVPLLVAIKARMVIGTITCSNIYHIVAIYVSAYKLLTEDIRTYRQLNIHFASKDPHCRNYVLKIYCSSSTMYL